MFEFLDGGMLFELNKYYQDLGQTALQTNPKLIIDIYQSYIDMGSEYITTCNYGFKSLKLDNYLELVKKSVNLGYQVKLLNKNKNIKLLGCLPPYYESYYQGKVTDEFIDFYQNIINVMESKVDAFILETQVSIQHIRAIMPIIVRSEKNIYISIYPNGEITGIELASLIELYGNRISAILLNCASFGEIKEYYIKHIQHLPLDKYDIKFGFYCNMIDEKKYLSYDGNKTNQVSLLDYKNEENIQKENLYQFLNKLMIYNNTIMIGGCCGYGIEEMRHLIGLINSYWVLQTSCKSRL